PVRAHPDPPPARGGRALPAAARRGAPGAGLLAAAEHRTERRGGGRASGLSRHQQLQPHLPPLAAHDPQRLAQGRGMSYLAHLHLGGDAPAQLLGSLYGDFVKGPLQGRFAAELEAAIRLHRRIDAFTDAHPLIERARARFPAERRRTSGILLDLFFDHCLARDWADFAAEPLGLFTARVYQVLAAQREL